MSSRSNPLTRTKKQKARALLQRNLPEEATPLLEQVCRTDPRDADAWFMLAAARQKAGDLMRAAETYRKVIALDPMHAEACYYLGNTYLALGDGPLALAAFDEATRLRPGYQEAWVNLGALHELQKNFSAAVEDFRKALHLDPRNAELYYNLGNVLHLQGKHAEAVVEYQRAITLRPTHADAYNNLGNALAHLDQYQEAISCYKEALRLNPRMEAAWNNAGNTYARQGQHDEAITSYQHALTINPNYAEAHTSQGNVRRHQGKLTEAIACHRHAIKINPDYADAHFNLAFALLVAGQFCEGWQEYSWYWKREGGQPRPFTASTWDGTDLGNRSVFLHAEQGLGDEIFFLRFAPALKHRGAGRITYRPHRKIASLLMRTSVIDEVAGPDTVPSANDWIFSVGDLPRLLGMERIEQIPPSITLTPLPAQVDTLRQRLATLGPPPYIGITWRAGTPAKELVLFKESPLMKIAHVLQDTPATVVILQRHPQTGEAETFAQALGRPAYDLSELNDDLEAMLALLSLVDEYVGVSNTNMHLRAAVGKTARVLVPAPPEWRWMAEGKESPWFPGFSVYRQGHDGSWEGAFAMLATDLKQSVEFKYVYSTKS